MSRDMSIKTQKHVEYLLNEFMRHEAEQTMLKARLYGADAPGLPPPFEHNTLRNMLEQRMYPDGRKGRNVSGDKGHEHLNTLSKSVIAAHAVAIPSKDFFPAFQRSNEAYMQAFSEEGVWGRVSNRPNDYVLLNVLFCELFNPHGREGYGPHFHNVSMKMGTDVNGKVWAVDKESVTRTIPYANACAQKDMDDFLQSKGLRTELRKDRVVCTDVPQFIVDKLSVRSQKVDQYLRENGIEPTPMARHIAYHQTKKDKQFYQHPEQLTLMKREIESLGLTVEQLIHKHESQSEQVRLWHAHHNTKQALQEVGRSQTFFNRLELLTHAALSAVGKPCHLEDVKRSANEILRDPIKHGIIAVEGHGYLLASELQRAHKLIDTLQQKIVTPPNGPEKPPPGEPPPEQPGVAQQKPSGPDGPKPADAAAMEPPPAATVEVKPARPQVTVEPDAVAQLIRETGKAGNLKRQFAAGKRFFFGARGNLQERLWLAELAFKEAGRVEKPIQRGDLITINNAGSVKIHDLELIIRRAGKAGAKVELKSIEKEIEEIRKVLEQHKSLTKHYKLTINH